MHVHILGICGTFMAGVAALAKAAGHKVTGSDAGAYPPMSTQLEEQGIGVLDGYAPQHLQPRPDTVVVGNALSRGNPEVEAMLNMSLPYTSGPQWLAENLLAGRHVLAVAGTHGKTTGAAMLAWILDQAGYQPGFLIGGMPADFGVSARIGEGECFVVEADEYDTAFFDKRSKFVHYRPRTLLLNNLEFDHADIFPDLAAIQRQFHHLIRTVPGEGTIIVNAEDENLAAVLAQGCWSKRVELHSADGWQARLEDEAGARFSVSLQGRPAAEVKWRLLGRHNVANALGAIAAAHRVGVSPADAAEALGRFGGVKRRLELRGERRGVWVYDDFAHHPTAIASTLAGMRARAGAHKLIAVLEPRSNTMRMGVHQDGLAEALQAADLAFVYRGDELDWDLAGALAPLQQRARILGEHRALADAVAEAAAEGDQVVIMSNGDFGDVHRLLLEALEG